MPRIPRLKASASALVLVSVAAMNAKADVITAFSATGTFVDTATLTGSVFIDTTTGVVTGVFLFVSAPDTLLFNTLQNQAANFPTAGDYAIQSGVTQSGLPNFNFGVATSSLIGYSGGPIASILGPANGFASGIRYSATGDVELYTGQLAVEGQTTVQGGAPFAPVALTLPVVGQVFGSIGGAGSQDYYLFNWAGGTFSATASITGPPNASASYLFSAGVVGTCGSGASATLDNSDSFTNTISIANLAQGQYCIGLDANNTNDPSFTLTFNTPVTGVPEPSTFGLFFAGLAVVGGCRRPKRNRRNPDFKAILGQGLFPSDLDDKVSTRSQPETTDLILPQRQIPRGARNQAPRFRISIFSRLIF